jgi:hypothetical protein
MFSEKENQNYNKMKLEEIMYYKFPAASSSDIRLAAKWIKEARLANRYKLLLDGTPQEDLNAKKDLEDILFDTVYWYNGLSWDDKRIKKTMYKLQTLIGKYLNYSEKQKN